MMDRITLTNGVQVLVDSEDYPLLSRYNWYLSNSGYARTAIVNLNKKSVFILMHRLIMGSGNGNVIYDHINQNKLDNRKINLRKVNKIENGINSKLGIRNTSGFKGVRKMGNRFYAYTTHKGKQVSFGSYTTAEEAAKERDRGMYILHGTVIQYFNFPNFIKERA